MPTAGQLLSMVNFSFNINMLRETNRENDAVADSSVIRSAFGRSPTFRHKS
jgi:hypothetical protein